MFILLELKNEVLYQTLFVVVYVYQNLYQFSNQSVSMRENWQPKTKK